MQSLQSLLFTEHLQVCPYFVTVTHSNLNFCRNLNTDIQSWPSKHKTRATLQSRCMLTKQNWLLVLNVPLKETPRKCLWYNELRCAIHPLTFPASLFRATINNDHRAGDSKSFLCPRIKYCTFYALLRQMVTPRTNRMSRPSQCTFCLLHQSTGRCSGKNNVRYAVAIHQPLNLRIVTSYPPLFLYCKLTSETKREHDSIHNHTVYHLPE